MFVPCPHCGFLPALIVAQGAPRRCPRCQGALPAVAITVSAAPADPTSASADCGDPDRGEPAGAVQPPASVGVSVGVAAFVDAVKALDAIEPVAGAAAEPAGASPNNPDVPTAGAQTPKSRASAAARPARRRGGKPGTPSFARAAHAPAAPGRRGPGLVVVAVLLVMLAAQLLLAQRAALAASTQWRPLIARVCATAGCALPPWHEPAAITMLDRGVHPDPNRPGVLAVQASFRNDARWPQPWPTLLLSLADIDGRPVAHGAFAPAEYGPPDAPPLLAPGQAASVRFMVREPGPHGVAFAFQFR